jgi:hypothetical protein
MELETKERGLVSSHVKIGKCCRMFYTELYIVMGTKITKFIRFTNQDENKGKFSFKSKS